MIKMDLERKDTYKASLITFKFLSFIPTSTVP